MGGKKVKGSAIGKFSRRMIGSLLGIRMSKINLSCSHLVNNKSEWKIYIKKFLKNPKIVSKMGLNGRKIVEKNFSDFAIINKLSKILRI